MRPGTTANLPLRRILLQCALMHFLTWVASPAFASLAEPAGGLAVTGPPHPQFQPVIYVQSAVPSTRFSNNSDEGGGGAAGEAGDGTRAAEEDQGEPNEQGDEARQDVEEEQGGQDVEESLDDGEWQQDKQGVAAQFERKEKKNSKDGKEQQGREKEKDKQDDGGQQDREGKQDWQADENQQEQEEEPQHQDDEESLDGSEKQPDKQDDEAQQGREEKQDRQADENQQEQEEEPQQQDDDVSLDGGEKQPDKQDVEAQPDRKEKKNKKDGKEQKDRKEKKNNSDEEPQHDREEEQDEQGDEVQQKHEEEQENRDDENQQEQEEEPKQQDDNESLDGGEKQPDKQDVEAQPDRKEKKNKKDGKEQKDRKEKKNNSDEEPQHDREEEQDEQGDVAQQDREEEQDEQDDVAQQDREGEKQQQDDEAQQDREEEQDKQDDEAQQDREQDREQQDDEAQQAKNSKKDKKEKRRQSDNDADQERAAVNRDKKKDGHDKQDETRDAGSGSAGDDSSTTADEDADVALGFVTLNWLPPTEYDDGAPLMDLAGFRIFWRNVDGGDDQLIDVDNPGLSAIIIGNLPAGTYEFTMTAYNAVGVESVSSNTITRIVEPATWADYAAGSVTNDDLSPSAADETEPMPYLMLTGGPPEAVIAGQLYLFTPAVETNSESAPVFTIEGLPHWAGFDETSGEIYGTPGEADVGLYESIAIAVTDGVIETSLPAFSIDVIAPGAAIGTITLFWLPPTEYENGAPLTDLAGYRIYWRNVNWSQSQLIDVDNPGLTAIVIGNLPAGIYEFTMTAFNVAGVESVASNSITRIVGVDAGYAAGMVTSDYLSQSAAEEADSSP